MADSFLSKAGALILSGAALLGVAYGGAKYVADFEAAKAEIQSLRGQIVQLQELLTKAQTGWDPARMERRSANRRPRRSRRRSPSIWRPAASAARPATIPVPGPSALPT